MLGAIAFGTIQGYHLLNVTNAGFLTSFAVFSLFFGIINLSLSIFAYRDDKRMGKDIGSSVQSVWIYILGTALYGTIVCIIFFKYAAPWLPIDTKVVFLVSIALLMIVIRGKIKKESVFSPMSRAYGALAFRTVPQSFMAFLITQQGGKGLNGYFIVVFHLLTLSRIATVLYSVSKNGMNQERKALLIGEIGNELSWTAVTICWVIQ